MEAQYGRSCHTCYTIGTQFQKSDIHNVGDMKKKCAGGRTKGKMNLGDSGFFTSCQDATALKLCLCLLLVLDLT